MSAADLDQLTPGQPIIFGGNRVVSVPDDLAEKFVAGDRVMVDPDSEQILHIPGSVAELTERTVTDALDAFADLADCTDDQIDEFFEAFARQLADDDSFAPVAAANADDVADATQRGRSTTRLVLDAKMRAQMIEGLLGWKAVDGGRDRSLQEWQYPAWSLSARSAPLGVVGFVFEGRPNVFADAAGVLRSGNTAVFRIGSDALRTAKAIMEHAVVPALEASSLPTGALGLLASPERSAGWALFSDSRLALAVARGSGPAVAQLAAVARQHGIDVSVHGTGGAWLLIDDGTDPQRVSAVVADSLDRKVCNTLNTVVLIGDGSDTGRSVLDGLAEAARTAGFAGRVHVTDRAVDLVERLDPGCFDRMVDVGRAEGVVAEPFASPLSDDELGTEWEWERSPEITIDVAPSIDDAIDRFNRHSPHFIASVLGGDRTLVERAYQRLDAPFFCDGMTRWVDGQFALQSPELGLSNWQAGRLLGRGGVLSGDGIFTVRYRAHIPGRLHR